VEKTYIYCPSCRSQREWDGYKKLESKEWDYKTPLYSNTMDKFFFDDGELNDYLEDQDEENDGDNIKIEDLQLVICEPEYPTEIEPNEIYCDLLPEDMDLKDMIPELDKAFECLNEKIRQCKENHDVLSWTPGKYRPVFEKEEVTNVR
jgi:hypothetical protein